MYSECYTFLVRNTFQLFCTTLIINERELDCVVFPIKKMQCVYPCQYDELQRVSAKDVEELATIREEKRTLSTTVENLRSELNQLQSKVKYLFLSSSV